MYLQKYNYWMKQENLDSYLKQMTNAEKEDGFYRKNVV